MKLGRHAIENASRRVAEYFWRRPHEVALGKDEDTFNRAKSEAVKVIRTALDEVERLEFADFEHQLKRGKLMSAPFWPWSAAPDKGDQP